MSEEKIIKQKMEDAELDEVVGGSSAQVSVCERNLKYLGLLDPNLEYPTWGAQERGVTAILKKYDVEMIVNTGADVPNEFYIKGESKTPFEVYSYLLKKYCKDNPDACFASGGMLYYLKDI